MGGSLINTLNATVPAQGGFVTQAMRTPTISYAQPVAYHPNAPQGQHPVAPVGQHPNAPQGQAFAIQQQIEAAQAQEQAKQKALADALRQQQAQQEQAQFAEPSGFYVNNS